ncbi:penicillin acylase family protein [Mesorhizobium retamae]|uniref:Penicillin acylase family protein n=1 Tax=Mesorhizobium retamae TaxID=2912854 RepID=A0ABS9QEW5_9HYPH|nr:penicillin acylase family protein [Mesorhizobium sp. IRAMC:0171]MCG7505423.1 penicillin acylase family protein [Mesorhizobium sp. IRAMC:0171]
MLDILKRYQVQDNNTIAVDAKETLLADIGNIPHVTDEMLQRCGTVDVLDGSRSDCEWGSDPDAARPGIFSPTKGVTRIGVPYVANSNNGPWMSVPDEPILGKARVFGEEKAELTPRARIGLTMLQDRLAGTLPGNKFDLDNAQKIFLRTRSKIGELITDDLIALCRANIASPVDAVDLKPACDALSGWNRTFVINARGAHLFREFRELGGVVFRIPFNPADPVNTPRQLATDDPNVLNALVAAVKKLKEKNIPLDARLGDVQFTLFKDERIGQRGSANADGVFNPIGLKPHRDGYAAAGSTSLVYFAEYSENHVASRGMIVYSLSNNPESKHSSDMTRAYSSGHIINWRFNESEIESDPHLIRYRVSN